MTGLNTTTLPPGSSGSFIANSNGTGIDFFAGVQPATATVIGGILTTTYAALAGNNVWIGQNSTPPVALTFSSSITPNFAGSVDLTATLTGTTTINCPTGPQAVGQKPVFYLTQGTGSGAGGFQATWDTCYGFPNHQPPVLTADSDGAKDMVGCSVIAASGPESIWCGTVQTAIGYGFLLRNNHSSVACTSATTCAITVSNVVAGDMVAFGVMESGSAGNPAAGDLVSISDANGNTCTRATGTFKVNTAAAPRATSISYCTITTSVPSGDVWTATWTPTEQFMTLHFVEVLGAAASPDIGKGNGATATSNAQTVTATGADTQPYQFVLAMLKGDSLGTVSAGAGFTLLDVQGQGTNPSATEYRFLPTATTATATFSTSASANYALSAAIFAHK
jgi:hypothetical protein